MYQVGSNAEPLRNATRLGYYLQTSSVFCVRTRSCGFFGGEVGTVRNVVLSVKRVRGQTDTTLHTPHILKFARSKAEGGRGYFPDAVQIVNGLAKNRDLQLIVGT